MKKTTAALLCLCLACTAAGCSPGNIADQLFQAGDPLPQEPVSDKPRVYMDEIRGKLLDFTGSQLTLKTDEQTYVFDVTQANLECKDGMITGDEVSVIYEGRLSDTDTSAVKALKVVDEFHKKNKLEDRTAHGEVLSLTPNTITIKAQNGKTATYPITGTKQYYQAGIQPGTWVYLHFKGKFQESDPKNPTVLNAGHLKVLSISDTEPFDVPKPTPTPLPGEEQTPEKRFRGTIHTLNMNVLQILLDGVPTPLNLDLSAVPSYFKGGTAPGSTVNVTYSGEFNGTTLEGITILSVTGADPDTLDRRRVNFTVTGSVVGATANTVTLQTTDGALVTCNTEDSQNASSQELTPGSNLKITFHPSESKTSNIYTALKIEDA